MSLQRVLVIVAVSGVTFFVGRWFGSREEAPTFTRVTLAENGEDGGVVRAHSVYLRCAP